MPQLGQSAPEMRNDVYGAEAEIKTEKHTHFKLKGGRFKGFGLHADNVGGS